VRTFRQVAVWRSDRRVSGVFSGDGWDEDH
jgi:hypothetical protein